MKIKSVNAVGFRITYHIETRTLLVTLIWWALSLHFPRTGNCNGCGHGYLAHVARKDRGMILWRCYAFTGGAAPRPDACGCKFYDPEAAV